MDPRRPLAIIVTAAGAVALVWAGYRAGQKNGIPVVGGGGGAAQLPTTGAILTQTGSQELEQDALKAAMDAALLG